MFKNQNYNFYITFKTTPINLFYGMFGYVGRVLFTIKHSTPYTAKKIIHSLVYVGVSVYELYLLAIKSEGEKNWLSLTHLAS